MDADLEPVYRQVIEAVHPEDLFGSEDVVLPASYLLEFLGSRAQQLEAICDPTVYRYPEDIDAATEARQKIERLLGEAKQRIQSHSYGFPGFGKVRPAHATKSFVVGSARYYLGLPLATGSHSKLHLGYLEREGVNVGEVVIKLALSEDENHFLERDARNLHLLHQLEVPQWKHLPLLLDTFRAGAKIGSVQRRSTGATLAAVRQHRTHREGVDQRHVVWMLDRLLSCLGYVHRQGLVHGSLNPDHVLIDARLHNATICGWGGAVFEPAVSGERPEVLDPIFSAPEVLEHAEVGPWSDIYSVGKLMIWALGGNAETDQIPEQVEVKLAQFLLKLVKRSHHSRPADAWELYEEQCSLKDSLWPRKFLHFDLS